MDKLILLYAGTCLLAWLSQQYNPSGMGLQTDRDRHFLLDPMDVYTLGIVVWMTLFSGLRTAYNDTGAYINGFNKAASSFAEFWTEGQTLGFAENPLFYLTQVLVKSVVDNYHVWFIMIAFFSNYIAVKFFRHYAPSFMLGILLFHAVGTYVLYMAAVKQSVAMAIAMCAIPFALNRKWLVYFPMILFAMLFHTHAFMLLIVPFMMGKPWGPITWILGVAAVFAMATYDSTLGIFVEYAQSIGANVSHSEVFDDHSLNALRVAVYAVPALLALIFRRRLFRDSGRAEDFMVNMSIVSMFILAIGLVEGGNLFARMAGYFEWATAIALPWMIGKLFNRKSVYFVSGCAAALYTVYFLYEFGVSKDFGNGYAAINLLELFDSLIA